MSPGLHTVWLVDDNEADNFLHQLLLEESGAVDTVVAFGSPEAALAAFSSGPAEARPNLLFLDLNMPRMSGWDFVECLRGSGPDACDGLELYMLSTSLSPEDQQRAADTEGITGYLGKPLTPRRILEIAAGHES